MERWTDQPNVIKSSCAKEIFFGKVGDHLVQVVELLGHSTNGLEYAITFGNLFGSKTLPFMKTLDQVMKELNALCAK